MAGRPPHKLNVPIINPHNQPLRSVLVTVPHGLPKGKRIKVTKELHEHDTIPAEVALHLAHLMDKEDINGKVIISWHSRHHCDMNRQESRDNEFREKVRKAVRPGTVLIDLHSYPSFGNSYAPYDICLLRNKGRRYSKALYSLFKNTLKGEGYKVGDIVIPKNRGDIVAEFPENSVLIELNEKYEGRENMLAKSLVKAMRGRANPPTAESRYKLFSKLPIDKKFKGTVPEPKGTLRNLGRLKQIRYHCSKWKNEGKENENVVYFHDFNEHPGNRPELMVDGAGNKFIIGMVKVIADGVTDWDGANTWTGKKRVTFDVPKKVAYLGRFVDITTEDGKVHTVRQAVLCSDPQGRHLFIVKTSAKPTHP